YWQAVASEANCQDSVEQRRRLTLIDNRSWSRPSLPIVRWAAQIKNAGYATAILSNMPLAVREYLEQECDWFPPFDHQVYSCDVRCIKPDARIYQHCLELLGVDAGEVLFLDDLAPNIEAARKLGMHTLLFQSPRQAADEVSKCFNLPQLQAVAHP
ncbi:MAG: HAD family hydrolase, partial [Terriglobales bacterium]